MAWGLDISAFDVIYSLIVLWMEINNDVEELFVMDIFVLFMMLLKLFLFEGVVEDVGLLVEFEIIDIDKILFWRCVTMAVKCVEFWIVFGDYDMFVLYIVVNVGRFFVVFVVCFLNDV